MDGSRELKLRAHSRDKVLVHAHAWLGTPYQHQASACGAGCDCLGLIRGVWRDLYGHEPEATPAYAPDWAERGAVETLRDAARRHMREIGVNAARAGDVVLFRIADAAPAKHAAILAADDRLLHAYWGRAVTLTSFTPWWRRRAVYAFSFPGVTD